MRNRSELAFSYRMEGLQPEWTESQGGSAIFSALPPGKYTFSGRTFNPSLNVFSPAVTVQVTILPPWWRNGWMLAVYAVVLMLLVALADWFRARNLKRLGRQLQRLVAARTQELEASREQLRVQATYDGLTGLLNRAAILRALATEIDRASREGKRLAVALADIDHFKQVNDTHGHLAGDEALRQFAKAVKSVIRAYDHVGRYGGEEFLLILTDLPEDFLHERLSALHAGMTNLAIETPESTFTINCSLGGMLLDPSEETISAEAILTTADIALYDAKADGRNRAIWRTSGGARIGLNQSLTPIEAKTQDTAHIQADLQETVSLPALKD
jgi:diguanylate cyclase (GGDEF)-like protein